MELRWLKKDYQGVIDMNMADNARLLTKPAHRWKAQSYVVRSFIRLQKPKEALQQAEAFNRNKNGPLLLLAAALAATGDVPRVVRFIESSPEQRYLIGDCYRDEDLGPILRGPAFASFRERFPEPPANP